MMLASHLSPVCIPNSARLAPLRPLQQRLFSRHLSRLKHQPVLTGMSPTRRLRQRKKTKMASHKPKVPVDAAGDSEGTVMTVVVSEVVSVEATVVGTGVVTANMVVSVAATASVEDTVYSEVVIVVANVVVSRFLQKKKISSLSVRLPRR